MENTLNPAPKPDFEEKNPEGIPEHVINDVKERDNGQCQVTGRKPVQYHHVTYRSQGGGHTTENIISLHPEIHLEEHEGSLSIEVFEPEDDVLVVANTETGELIDDLWWYERPDRNASEAHVIRQNIVEIEHERRRDCLTLGMYFDLVERKSLYKPYHETFSAYVSDPEVDVSPKTAHRYKSVYRKLFVKANLSAEVILDMGIKKAEIVSRYWNDPDLEKIIDYARNNSTTDLLDYLGVEDKKKDSSGAESSENDNDTVPGYIGKVEERINQLKRRPDDEELILEIINIAKEKLRQISGNIKAE